MTCMHCLAQRAARALTLYYDAEDPCTASAALEIARRTVLTLGDRTTCACASKPEPLAQVIERVWLDYAPLAAHANTQTDVALHTARSIRVLTKLVIAHPSIDARVHLDELAELLVAVLEGVTREDNT